MLSFRPELLITHWFDDMHPDHEAAFLILRRALVSSFLSNSIDSLKTAPQVFCCDTYGSRGLRGPFQPDQLVDVTHVWEKKLAAVHAHESQPLPFYLDMIESQCLAHGRATVARYAEAFLHVPLFGWADDKLNLGQEVEMRFCEQ
jgi:LmbE family N-acetylglucosaminyl deacetylase